MNYWTTRSFLKEDIEIISFFIFLRSVLKIGFVQGFHFSDGRMQTALCFKKHFQYGGRTRENI